MRAEATWRNAHVTVAVAIRKICGKGPQAIPASELLRASIPLLARWLLTQRAKLVNGSRVGQVGPVDSCGQV